MADRRLYPLAAVLLLTGCSAESYREAADKETKEIIVAKREVVTGKSEPFDLKRNLIVLEQVGRQGEVEDLKNTEKPKPIIEPLEIEERTPPEPPAAPAGAAPAATETPPAAPAATPPPPPASGGLLAQEEPVRAPKIPARILDLPDVLAVAFANNREYQSQKESVYLNALALTLVRWRFAPQFFGIIGGDFQRESDGDKSAGISTGFGFSKLFASGARFSLNIANNFLLFVTGERREVANTIISGTLTQPLLRGFGSHIVEEPVIQAERNVIYQVRAFERYRQNFIVQVASDFYRVLALRQRVSDEYLNWQGLVNNLDRAQELAKGERLPQFEVDQVLQQELTARNRYVVTIESYLSALDRLKVTLNIPIDVSVGLDKEALVRLREIPDQVREVAADDAIAAALRLRLDFLSEQDQLEDARRKVAVAADGLRAQLDLRANGGIGSGPDGGQQPLKFDADTGTYGVGFDMDLPFDRRAERNEYVQALIAVDAQERSTSLLEDNIRVDVRDALRSLLRERETYEIQKASVKLAEARVESTNALRDAGRADTRDVLESQQALIEARNALTSALISLAIARLEFSSATGTLKVLDAGRFIEEEITKASVESEKPGDSTAGESGKGSREGPVSMREPSGNETRNG